MRKPHGGGSVKARFACIAIALKALGKECYLCGTMKSTQQMTLRLPQDLAERLAACTPSRKRNQFVVDLVRRELDRESRELEEAAMRLSSLEAAHTAEDAQWLALADDEAAWGEFDEKRFLKELRAKARKAPQTPEAVGP